LFGDGRVQSRLLKLGSRANGVHQSDECHDDNRANDDQNKSYYQHWEQAVVGAGSACIFTGADHRPAGLVIVNHGLPFERVWHLAFDEATCSIFVGHWDSRMQ
jgi:hypothetical protein